MSPSPQHYEALTSGVGFADPGSRTSLLLTGGDRRKFLHNFCTADIIGRPADSGTEAFITNVKGKILSHVFVLPLGDALMLDGVADQSEVLVPHLDRYTLADDVEIEDASDRWRRLFVGGAQAPQLLESLLQVPLPPNYLDVTGASAGEGELYLARGGVGGKDGFTLLVAADQLAPVAEQLRAAGATECPPETLEVVRVEQGVPLYGIDITENNLPQEVNRDALALSLTKGCYLGQETVARLDALGHVNRLLMGVKFAGGQVPPTGCELTAGDKVVGRVTSAVFSPKLGSPLAMAYVRTGHEQPGSRLESPCGEAEVTALPV